jgi:1,4-dihydroxy-2-naphthoyl-CoA hydrolase
MTARPLQEMLRSTEGLLGTLGVEIAEAGPDGCVLTLEVTDRHVQPMGILHGGVHCALVESAASIAGAAWLAGRGSVVGCSNHTDFLRPVRPGHRLTARASAIHRGRTQQLWLVEITDPDGRLIARGEVRLANLAADG